MNLQTGPNLLLVLLLLEVLFWWFAACRKKENISAHELLKSWKAISIIIYKIMKISILFFL